jgi:hypothetical protein
MKEDDEEEGDDDNMIIHGFADTVSLMIPQ